jgi:hypothetical protein
MEPAFLAGQMAVEPVIGFLGVLQGGDQGARGPRVAREAGRQSCAGADPGVRIAQQLLRELTQGREQAGDGRPLRRIGRDDGRVRDELDQRCPGVAERLMVEAVCRRGHRSDPNGGLCSGDQREGCGVDVGNHLSAGEQVPGRHRLAVLGVAGRLEQGGGRWRARRRIRVKGPVAGAGGVADPLQVRLVASGRVGLTQQFLVASHEVAGLDEDCQVFQQCGSQRTRFSIPGKDILDDHVRRGIRQRRRHEPDERPCRGTDAALVQHRAIQIADSGALGLRIVSDEREQLLRRIRGPPVGVIEAVPVHPHQRFEQRIHPWIMSPRGDGIELRDRCSRSQTGRRVARKRGLLPRTCSVPAASARRVGHPDPRRRCLRTRSRRRDGV